MRWTEEAATRFRQIHEYLVERNPKAASDTVRGIHRIAESLDRLPERGFTHRTRGGREVRIVLYGHYRVVYQVDSGKRRRDWDLPRRDGSAAVPAVNFRIADTFADSLGRLTAEEQKLATTAFARIVRENLRSAA